MIAFVYKDLLHHKGQTLLHGLGLAVVIFSYLILTSLAATLDSWLQENRLNRNLIIVQTDLIDLGAATISEGALQAAQELVPALVSRVSLLVYRDIRLDGRMVQLRVTDTGIGMDAEALARIFEPYFSTKAIGTGLGLTIAKRNTEANGGSIQVTSERGRGTTVTITLPLA